MPQGEFRDGISRVWRRGDPLWGQSADQLAHYMIRTFGPAAAGKAVEMVRQQTRDGNRDAAVLWHRVMSLIEDARRKAP